MALSSKLRSLIIGKVWPEPTATAAGRRTTDILQALCAAGHELHFASASAKPDQALDLSAFRVSEHAVQVNDSSFDDWIAELDPDIVFFDRFMTEEQYGWRVEKRCPAALRLLDTSDLHCLRRAREDVVLNAAEFDLFNDVALREIASIHRCDLSLMISEFEMRLLQETFAVPESQIAYWPFFMSLPEETPGFDDRAHCILIGSFLHAPNLDAARWCVDQIWPRVHSALPDVALHLYGSYGDKYAKELHHPERGIHFKGRADDALQTMQQYRLNLAPLRFGAGLKGKLFDGFETGTPAVVTPIALEGIAESADWGCAATDDPQQFADAVITHYQNEAEWNALQERGRQIASSRFREDDWKPRLQELLRSALSAYEGNRMNHFTGRMLRHHHHRSTEFMSRWIELKQRLQD